MYHSDINMLRKQKGPNFASDPYVTEIKYSKTLHL